MNKKKFNNDNSRSSENDPIHSISEEEKKPGRKTCNYREIIAENIEYKDQMKCLNSSDAERYTEMYELICDVVTGQRKNMIIGGSEYTAEYVRERFLRLRSTHLIYVLHCLDQTDTRIINIRSCPEVKVFIYRKSLDICILNDRMYAHKNHANGVKDETYI